MSKTIVFSFCPRTFFCSKSSETLKKSISGGRQNLRRGGEPVRWSGQNSLEFSYTSCNGNLGIRA